MILSKTKQDKLIEWFVASMIAGCVTCYSSQEIGLLFPKVLGDEIKVDERRFGSVCNVRSCKKGVAARAYFLFSKVQIQDVSEDSP